MSETAELVIAPEQAKVVGRELEVRVSSLADRMAAVSVLDQASCAQAVADRQELGQAIKRVHRQGVKNSVTVHHIYAKGTIDEHILKVLEGKSTLQNGLLEAMRK